MKCPVCEQEMLNGKVAVYEWGNVLMAATNSSHATVKFVPEDKSEQTVKSSAHQGWYCKYCRNIVTFSKVEKY